MARVYADPFFSIVTRAQLPNQLWDSLAQATGSSGLIPHEDLGKPRSRTLVL